MSVTAIQLTIASTIISLGSSATAAPCSSCEEKGNMDTKRDRSRGLDSLSPPE